MHSGNSEHIGFTSTTREIKQQMKHYMLILVPCSSWWNKWRFSIRMRGVGHKISHRPGFDHLPDPPACIIPLLLVCLSWISSVTLYWPCSNKWTLMIPIWPVCNVLAARNICCSWQWCRWMIKVQSSWAAAVLIAPQCRNWTAQYYIWMEHWLMDAILSLLSLMRQLRIVSVYNRNICMCWPLVLWADEYVLHTNWM